MYLVSSQYSSLFPPPHPRLAASSSSSFPTPHSHPTTHTLSSHTHNLDSSLLNTRIFLILSYSLSFLIASAFIFQFCARDFCHCWQHLNAFLQILSLIYIQGGLNSDALIGCLDCIQYANCLSAKVSIQGSTSAMGGVYRVGSQ